MSSQDDQGDEPSAGSPGQLPVAEANANSGSSALERGYRRLLAWYPAEHRSVYGDEMLGVLTDAASGRRTNRHGAGCAC